VCLELRAGDSSSQVSASLLDSICDVTVDLDWGLRITGHSSQLAELLFRSPVTSLMGRMLQDFMPEHTDRERFDERMMGADEAAEHAAVSHTKLRDAVGGTIDMELFSVAFKGADDRRRYVPGMHEFADIQTIMAGLPRLLAAARGNQKSARPMRNGPGTPASLEHGELQSVASASSSSCSSASSASSSTSQAATTPTLIPTRAEAKTMTMSFLLNSWHVPCLSGDCCSWHGGIRAGTETLSKLARFHCTGEHEWETLWQCICCGIKSEEFKRKNGSARCNLFIDTPSDVFIRPELVQTNN